MNIYENNIIKNTNTIIEFIDFYIDKYKNIITKNYKSHITAYTDLYNFELDEVVKDKEFTIIDIIKNKVLMIEIIDVNSGEIITIYNNIPFNFKIKTEYIDNRNLDMLTIGTNFKEYEIVLCEHVKEV